MRRMWAASAAMVACLALGAMTTTAQDETEPVGGNAWYVGTATCPEVVSPGTATYENGVEQVRDAVYDCMSATDAPRLNGPYTLHHNYDCYLLTTPTPGYSGCVMWGTSVSPEPYGWSAIYTGAEDASGQQTVQAIGVGFGANAGWVFYEVDTLSAASGTNDVEGLLYQGAPPPAVPLPSLASE
jgi:hypothetical protein